MLLLRVQYLLLFQKEIFGKLFETKVLAECRRIEYNTFGPHSSLGYRAPAPEAKLCLVLSCEVVHIIGAVQERQPGAYGYEPRDYERQIFS